MAAELDPQFDPLFQRGYDPAVHRTRVKPVEPPGVTPGPDGGWEREETDTSEEPILRRNPFLVVLPVLGFAFLAVSAGLVAKMNASFYNQISGPIASDEGAWLAVISGVLPATLTGGLISLTAWLTLLSLPRRHG